MRARWKRRFQGPLRGTAFWLLAAAFPLLYYGGTGAAGGALTLAALGLLAGAAALTAAVY